MRRKLSHGFVQVYTGDGKGKTTAAFGLALRACGAGLKVYIQQFAKCDGCSGVKALKKIKNVEISCCGGRMFVAKKPHPSDVQRAKKGFIEASERISSRKFDVVILDEINIAVALGLVKKTEVEELIINKPSDVELVLTGRRCPLSIKKLADLVTEMREVKHPYRNGVAARRGIDY